jgi:hypothetical protein
MPQDFTHIHPLSILSQPILRSPGFIEPDNDQAIHTQHELIHLVLLTSQMLSRQNDSDDDSLTRFLADSPPFKATKPTDTRPT